MKSILKEIQVGLRSGYYTVDFISARMALVKVRISTESQKLFGFFIDFSSAFDHVDRDALFYKLFWFGFLQNWSVSDGSSIMLTSAENRLKHY